MSTDSKCKETCSWEVGGVSQHHEQDIYSKTRGESHCPFLVEGGTSTLFVA